MFSYSKLKSFQILFQYKYYKEKKNKAFLFNQIAIMILGVLGAKFFVCLFVCFLMDYFWINVSFLYLPLLFFSTLNKHVKHFEY